MGLAFPRASGNQRVIRSLTASACHILRHPYSIRWRRSQCHFTLIAADLLGEAQTGLGALYANATHIRSII
jgi:hypothetical protein